MSNMKDGLSESDESDDEYINSVAVLKALRKKNYRRIVDDNFEIEHDSSEESQMVQETSEVTAVPEIIPVSNPKSSPASTIEQPNATVEIEDDRRYPTRRTNNKYCTQKDINSEDLEIVSVEPANPDMICEIIDDDDDNSNDVINLSQNSSDNENYDIDIKVLWCSHKVHRLTINQNDNFQKVFQHFADLEKVPIEKILLTRKEKLISHKDTPASINLSVIDILEGGIVNTGVIQSDTEVNEKDDVCEIKVQSSTRQFFIIPLKKHEQFKILLAKCSEQLGVEQSQIKLFFDGEQIDVTDTPESLDLEQEACIDLRVAGG